jgi:hypothetical protein
MRLSLRSLLIWLMVLAMPVQAVAAAGMQHCGAAHRLMQVGSSAAVALDGHDPVHEATPHQHPDADAGGLDIEMSAGDPSDAGLNTTALGDDYTCSACANCCSAVALPASLVRLPAPSVEDHAAALPATDVVSFMPGGIDRPPRTVLA